MSTRSGSFTQQQLPHGSASKETPDLPSVSSKRSDPGHLGQSDFGQSEQGSGHGQASSAVASRGGVKDPASQPAVRVSSTEGEKGSGKESVVPLRKPKQPEAQARASVVPEDAPAVPWFWADALKLQSQGKHQKD